MCGIAGFLRDGFPGSGEGELRRMGQVIIHRGPDAGGEYLDDRVALAHRRLSILDLSAAGNQPMTSACGRYVIVFNGEIYNFPSLRRRLEENGYPFRSRTDTEVILALYAEQGVRCLDQLNGMFAFALWDREERTLFLARDRIGKKPLYYYSDGAGRFAFASEIKSLLQLPGMPRQVEPTAVADYLKYLYIPAPGTIFRNIGKLRPGHYMLVKPGEEPLSFEYWDVDFSRETSLTFEQAEQELVELLTDSTTSRMIADVPLGAFLSGGVDSSAVVALMARSASGPVKTCSIGFMDRAHDETPYAREVAKLFATDHVEYVVSGNLCDTVSLLPRFFDEPFADSSAVPTYHVSRLARQAVTVALAGDGGDENFGGYEKYTTELRENLARTVVPRPLLSALNLMARGGEGALFRKARTLTGSALRDPARAFYGTNTFIDDDLLGQLLAEPLRAACHGYDPAVHTVSHWDRAGGADHVTRMLYTDIKTYLPGDILVKVDRMSMAHSLEVRAPFLDYRIVEFAATLPSRWKIRDREKKIILRNAFARLLPADILNRRKHGFTVPLERWFRADLRDFSESRFFRGDAAAHYFSLPVLRRIWDEHQSGRADHGTLLWSMLSLVLWHDEYLGGGNRPAGFDREHRESLEARHV